MTKPLCLAAFLFATALVTSFSSIADDTAVGFFVEPAIERDEKVEVDDAEREIDAFCIRKGERIRIVEGMQAFAGDTVVTEKEATIAVAFLDSCAVTVRPGSRVKIDDYNYPARREPTHLTLESGKAFFDINPRPADAHFFVRTAGGEVEVKGTKFEVFAHADAEGIKTSVAVTDGKVSLKPNGQNAVDIFHGTQLVLTIMNQKGLPALPADIKKGNLTKDEIKMLRGNALSDIQVSVGKKNDIKIKSMTRNCDGTTTFIKLTEVNGKRVSVSTVTVGADNKQLSKVSEKGTKKSITVVDGSLKISEKMDNGAGKVTMKDKAAKLSLKGTVTTLANGMEMAVATGKDGTKIVFTRHILPDGTRIETTTKFLAGAAEGQQTTRIYRTHCDVETTVEAVTSAQLSNGDFENVAGTIAQIIPAIPPVGPETPLSFTPSTLLVGDPQPVSP